MHFSVVNIWYERKICVENVVVDMYAECGILIKTQRENTSIWILIPYPYVLNRF